MDHGCILLSRIGYPFSSKTRNIGSKSFCFTLIDRNEYLTRKCLADAISSRDKDERTPLIYAADEGLLETVRWLVVEGADISASDKDGKTPLDFAVMRNVKNVELLKLLSQASELIE